MGRYIVRRLLFAIPTLLVLSFCIFVLVSVAPGDPAEELARRTAPGGNMTAADLARARAELRLNRPFVNQYASWLLGAVQGDFGTSFVTRTQVSAEIGGRVRATAELASAAFLLVVLAAAPLGVLAALAHRRFADHALRLVALILASVPGFVLAYVLITVFTTRLRVFPVAGRAGVDTYVLPAIALAVGPLAVLSRLLRSSLLEVFTEDYMRTARAKGLSALQVAWRHGLRNAGIPVVTLMGGLLARAPRRDPHHRGDLRLARSRSPHVRSDLLPRPPDAPRSRRARRCRLHPDEPPGRRLLPPARPSDAAGGGVRWRQLTR